MSDLEKWDFQTALGDTIREKYADQNVKVVEVSDGIMLRFKGKFQEACQINWGGRHYYNDGYLRHQHCHCEVCTKLRLEQNLPRCYGKNAPFEERCLACQRRGIMIKYPSGKEQSRS